MILKTKEFQQVCNTILPAVGENAANLELKVDSDYLLLNVTNREYYVSCKFLVEGAEDFLAVVDANLFLTLISGISTETIELTISNNTVVVKAGKSNYKLAMIYENDKLMTLPKISLETKSVEMAVSNDILQSILTVNSKEVLKAKSIGTSELSKLYFITEEGCLTFTDGACLNRFTLEKPIKLLLNDRIVKLFKLFKNDVQFAYGNDVYGSSVQSKAVFQTDDIYLAALITNDNILLNKVQGNYASVKNYLQQHFSNKLVLSTKAFAGAIDRLLLFTKNSVAKVNMYLVPATCTVTQDEFIIKDIQGNVETVTIENDSFIGNQYEFGLNLADIKLVLDSCKADHITINCDTDGIEKIVLINRSSIANIIPECELN